MFIPDYTLWQKNKSVPFPYTPFYVARFRGLRDVIREAVPACVDPSSRARVGEKGGCRLTMKGDLTEGESLSLA